MKQLPKDKKNRISFSIYSRSNITYSQFRFFSHPKAAEKLSFEELKSTMKNWRAQCHAKAPDSVKEFAVQMEAGEYRILLSAVMTTS